MLSVSSPSGSRLRASEALFRVDIDVEVFRRPLSVVCDVVVRDNHENGLVNLRPGRAGGGGMEVEDGLVAPVAHGTDGRLDINP